MPKSNTLTPLENNCLAKLVEAWDIFVTMPELHLDDMLEFRIAVHNAQNIILVRPYLRAIAEG